MKRTTLVIILLAILVASCLVMTACAQEPPIHTPKHTVTWQNWDGTVLEVDAEVEEGTIPVYNGGTPTKEADVQYTYEFSGWDKAVTAVTGKTVYTAKFDAILNSYTVTWQNWDGSVLELDENVEYGKMPSYDGETPTKEGNAQYNYTFSGWNPNVDEVTGNVTYVAQFTSEVNKYTVTWLNWDGAVLQMGEVEYGTMPTYAGSTPTKGGNAQYTYTFTGWTPSINIVTGDVSYTAQFSTEVNEYTVTWQNWDGSVLELDESVEFGATPSYDGATPTKEGNAQYNYTFSGWNPNVGEVTGNVTYVAQFTSEVNKYTVTWLNWDGAVLQMGEVEYGTMPTYAGSTPTKGGNAQYTYTFTGWTPSINIVTGDVSYTAQFSAGVNKYTVTWKNWDGSVLELDENVEFGVTPSYDGETPTKEGNAQYSYTFSGWNPNVDEVTCNVTYVAQYSHATNKYTVTWLNWDGAVLQMGEVEYGTMPTYAGSTPTKGGNAQYTYTFTGWTPSINIVTGDVSYTAQFSAGVNKYTVTWQNWDGSVLEIDENVEYGKMPSYDGETPTRERDAQYTYTFSGWEPSVDSVTGNVTYVAQYSTEINKYTVTWQNWNGSVLEIDENVEYGKMPSYDGETPTRERDAQYTYVFNSWNEKVSNVTGDVTYTAQFNQYIHYSITYNLDGGENNPSNPTYYTVLSETITLLHPTKTGYTFVGWIYADQTTPQLDVSITQGTTGDKEYTANWQANTYTLTYKDIYNSSYNYGRDRNVTVTFGSSFQLLNPSRTGYTFLGWYNGEDKFESGTWNFTSDITLTADWQANLYTITFVSNGGSIVEPITQPCDSPIEYPKSTIPEKSFVGWFDEQLQNEYHLDKMPSSDITVYAKWIDYEVSLFSKEINAVSVYQEINPELFSASAVDTDGNEVIVSVKIIGGTFAEGNTIAVRLIATGLYDIYATKTISNIKVYGTPTLTFDNEKNFINYDTDEINAELFTLSAIDSFNNELTVNIELDSGELEGGKIVVFKFSATDCVGNCAEVFTDEIKLYSASDIKITCAKQASNIKLTSNGEEFGASAVNSFGETCQITIEAAEGYTLEGGNSISMYIVATDVMGNTTKSSLIPNIKIYDMPILTYQRDTDYIQTGDSPYDLFSVTDSFGNELLFDVEIKSGSLDVDEKIIYTITAKDRVKNELIVDYELSVLAADESILYFYINNELVDTKRIYTDELLNTEFLGYICYIDDVAISDDKGNGLENWNFEPKGYKVICKLVEYTIEYELDGGTNSSLNPFEYSVEDSITLVVPTKTGYAFTGWTGADLAEPTMVVVIEECIGNRSYVATWQANTYNYTLETNGGEVSDESISIIYGQESTLPTPEKSGVTFGGWFIDVGLTVEFSAKTMPASDSTIYAWWKEEAKPNDFSYDVDSNNFVKIKDYLGEHTSLVIPTHIGGVSLISIASYAFKSCTSLTSITIPASVTTIGMYAFESCTSLTSVTFGENSQLTTIGVAAFYKCTNLTSIVIPDSVTTIGSSAFNGCTSLTSIVIPDSVTSIGTHAFYKCTSLTSIIVDEDNPKYQSIDGNLYTKDGKTLVQFVNDEKNYFEIPNGVTTIESEAFSGKILLVITIPDSVTTIGRNAFEFCGLTRVTFKDPNGWYVTQTEGATSGKTVTLTDASSNANCLNNIYVNYYWYKK